MEAQLLLTLLFSLLFIPLSIAQAPQSLAQNCDNSIRNYTSNSTFQTNLNLLLSDLTSKASTSGYSAGSLGTIPDHVYGLVLCRGDASREACRTCLSTASRDILEGCPFRKAATIWYDNCQLRYSSRRFGATVDTGVRLFTQNTKNVSYSYSCDNSIGNYTSSSTFQTNLYSLRESLAYRLGSNNGSADDSFGDAPDSVYGQVFCRGDVDRDSCRTCLLSVYREVPKVCPVQKGASIWYDDCQLRYSSRPFAATVDTSYRLFMWNTQSISSEWPRFNESLVRLLNGLTQYTTAAPRLFGTGDIPVKGEFPKIYALVQCTRDLTSDGCNQCLNTIVQDLPNCCNKKIGGRVLASSCNFRYEVSQFFNGTSKLQLPGVGNAPGPALPPVLPPTFNSTPPNNPTDKKGNNRNRRIKIILSIVIPVGAAILLLSLICYRFCLKHKSAAKKSRKASQGKEDYEELISMEALLFDLSTIINVTNNFSESNKLGEGGFGAVYKGTLRDGQDIAAKRLSKGSAQGINELRNEVGLLAKLKHRNLVRLLGVCLEEEEKILVYEYVQNKSLEKILFDTVKKEQLQWERRYKIINGIARGMLYLHEESPNKIIHRDLKVSNILLDADLDPKISDFGLARLFGGDQTQANTSRVVGTFGYMSPEYVIRGHFSNKSDVFSFGVIILEIVTGQRNNGFFASENSTDLLSYVWGHWLNGTVLDIVDSSLGGKYSQNEALRCIQIGLLCVQEAPAERPTMSAIILMLNSNPISAPIPSQPAFFAEYNTIDLPNNGRISSNFGATSNKSTTKWGPYTQNELSITEFEPR